MSSYLFMNRREINWLMDQVPNRAALKLAMWVILADNDLFSEVLQNPIKGYLEDLLKEQLNCSAEILSHDGRSVKIWIEDITSASLFKLQIP